MNEQLLYCQMTPEEVIKLCNPNFDLIRKLIPVSGVRSTTDVFLVKETEQEYVLKIAEYNSTHLETESKALEILNYIDDRITHLINVYKNQSKNLSCLQKEYEQGQFLQKWSDEDDYNHLKETIGIMHNYGIAGVDVIPDNIVKSGKTGNPTIIDLSAVKFEKDWKNNPHQFETYKRQDYSELDLLFL